MAPQELSSREASTFEQSLKDLRQQVATVVEQMRGANSPKDVLEMAAIQVRQMLRVDRVLMLRFLAPRTDGISTSLSSEMLFREDARDSVLSYLYSTRNDGNVGDGGNARSNGNGGNGYRNGSKDADEFSGHKGLVVAESLGRGWTPTRGQAVHLTGFGFDTPDEYLSHPFVSIADTDRTNLTPYQRQILERYQVKASLNVPVCIGRNFWGVMSVQQCDRSYQWAEREIVFVRQVVAEMAVMMQQFDLDRSVDETVAILRESFQHETDTFELATARDRAVTQTIDRIRRTLEIETIFDTATKEVRSLVECDRVGVYRFNPDWSGAFVAESVGPGWAPLVERQEQIPDLQRNISDCDSFKPLIDASSYIEPQYEDSYLKVTKGGRFAEKKTFTVTDIYDAGFTPCYLNVLKQYQCRSYSIVPIFQGERLWGLLAAYQNDAPRQWEDDEVGLLVRIAEQLGIALQQAENLAQLRKQSRQLEKSADRDRAVAQTIDRIRRKLDVDDIFNTTTNEVRALLECDRVGVYRFNPDWSGGFVAESVAAGWIPLIERQKLDPSMGSASDCDSLQPLIDASAYVDTQFNDTYLKDNKGGRFAEKKSFTVTDIYDPGFTACYTEVLEKYQCRSYSIVPIFEGPRLWGMLAAYQNDAPREWEGVEVRLLERIADQLGIALQQAGNIERLRKQSMQLSKAADRDRAVTQTIDRIRRTLDVDTIFDTTTSEVRTLLECDRVGVYRFNPDWSGGFVAESVGSTWIPLVTRQEQLPALKRNVSNCDSLKPLIEASTFTEVQYDDTYLKETQGGRFAENQTFSVTDIYAAGFTPCYMEILEQYQCRAYAIVPIFQGERLWGLLAAYQNDAPREWEEAEVQLLAQIGNQLGVALQQSQFLNKVQEQAKELEAASQRDKAAKEDLQRKALDLLMAVRPALDGDLTVRAPVTEDEMGTLADSYNNTLQSLRRIIVQVQGAVAEVVNTSETSDESLIELSSQAQKQVEEISNAVGQIQAMVNFTEETAKNALEVETAIETANQTLQSGDDAMNRTVEGITDIRKTVTEAAKSIKRLTQSSQDIAKVVSLINNFATQTNLLALNAAIEATRAGEYGRGFAVVADEVRSLARQSGDATTEIEKLVQDIQEETKEVTLAMQMASEQVTRGTSLVGETRETLNDIVAATVQIGTLVEGIATATREQTQQAQSVTQVMQEVASIADRTSENSIEISQSFKDALSTVQELKASAGQFKVD
ncbi:MAG: GAF domain-containing protein [Geitlerinemataceae cyanobacterium]